MSLILLLLSGCAHDESWDDIQTSGVLRIGIDPTFPPFALAEGTAIEGIDADLGRTLAAELGLEPQFTYFGYDGLYDALATRQVDVLISALVVAPERMKDVAYSTPYFDAGQFLFIPAASDVREMADLDGRTLAVELGALGHVEALEQQRRLRALTVQTYGSVAEALDAAAGGQADAALVDSVGGRLYLAGRDAGLTQLPEPVLAEPYALAVRIEDRTLLDELNNALTHLTADGRLDVVLDRWLGP